MASIYNLQRLISMTGTKSNVEALSGTLTEICLAYATDTSQIGLFDGSDWHWGIGSLALDDLSDTTITTPTADQVLVYNGAEWVNAAAPVSAGEFLVADGVTPLEMLTTEDETDYIYEG